MTTWSPALFALFAWWFSTGAILWVVKSADRDGLRARRRAVLLGLPVLVAGCAGFWATLYSNDTASVYIAFVSALAIWGWIELAFLTGVITGPNRSPLPDGTAPFERFIRAWGTVAYHEMLLAAALVTMFLISQDHVNPFGIWTFAVLFFARVSAKLNLFLGVPKINVEFLPDALAHLPSHFRYKTMNWLFPVSVTALTFAAACWLERIAATSAPGASAGFVLLTAITALALFEHWMMVLPIPDEKLWRWMIPASGPATYKSTKETLPTGTTEGGHHGL